MNSISLESLVSSSCYHWIAASLFGYWLLDWLDLRRLATVPKIFLTGSAVAASLRSFLYTEQTSHRVVWGICDLMALVVLIKSIRQWTSTTPSELYDEAHQVNASKSKLKKEDEKERASHTAITKRFPGVGLAAWLVALGCLIYVKQPEFWDLKSPVRYFAGVELGGTALMLGMSLFLCAELTLISSPDALNALGRTSRVSWRTVSTLALAISASMLVCCLAQFLQKSEATSLSSDDKMVHIAARVFGLMLLLAIFVVWMVPHRLSSYQKANSIPKDWVSLTLTAWLGMLAFLVVATLPANWPWQILIK